MTTTAARKRIPATAPKPQDHKTKRSTAARKAEAGDGYAVIKQCGVTLRIPVAPGTVPVAAIDKFRDGDNFAGIKALLGKEQWQALCDAGMTVDDLNEIDGKVKEVAGN